MSLPSVVFDRPLIARHLARRPAPGPDFVSALVLDDLQERLVTVTRDFSTALIMAPDASVLPRRGETRNGTFPYEHAATLVPSEGAVFVDPEHLALPRRDYQLIVSVLDIQTINDVPGFMVQVRRHLAPDGLFLAAWIGGASLGELRQAFLVADAELSGGAFARVAPFIDVGDAGQLLQRAGFAVPVVDLETHIVRYAHPVALMSEIKALGASNPLADRPGKLATQRLIARASEAYQAAASDADGRIRATLELVWVSGWAPHESQQKPLAPGSAQVSLKDVLGKTQG